MPQFLRLYCKYFMLITTIFALSFNAKAQTETLSTGSFIINMGATNPNTVANGLKPYGLIYDLIKNNSVPIKLVIGAGKIKDGVDFTYNGVQYKGGTYIIPGPYRSAAVDAKITSWQGQGVVGTTTTSALTVNVTQTLKEVPRWTLDAANGDIAKGYLDNAGITLAAFPGAYNWKSPQTLDCCDDFFVMPHADPTWASHSNLFFWNQNCLGSIWAACHAVSALENSINPANSTQQMNFLSTRTSATTPTPWPNNSLTLWGSHAGGSVPYTSQFFDDPIAQYMGSADAAFLNGSEQIYLPKQGVSPNNTRWRPGAKIISYDPTQANVTAPDLANGNIAALMVYGRAFDNPARGYVMYEAGHSHNKGTAADVAAQRAFFNFSFFQVQPKSPIINVSGIVGAQNINSGSVTNVSVSATSPLAGVTFSYLWTSSCGGTFANATAASTTFTAPTVASTTPCILTCKVSDNCGRASFQSFPVTIVPTPVGPTANPDLASVSVTCGGGTSVTTNVLTNDVTAGGLLLTLTNVTGAVNGTVSFTAAGNVTFVPNANFTGPLVLTYTVCNNATPTPLCSNSTLTISTTGGSTPAAANDGFTIAEDAIGTFNVLANDAVGLTVIGITAGPANGRVSINTDNTITYVPNADFGGPTDNFTYRVTNGSGGYNTATVTVTVTNDACNGGTFQVGSASATEVSGNEWSKVYTRPVNTGGTNLTNTTAYPINAGPNRLLVVAISAGGPNTAGVVPTVTWGGQSLTSLSVNRTDNNRAYSFIFYLKQSGIIAASGSNLIVNMAAGTETYFGYVVYAAVYQNVDQTTTVRNAVSPNISGSTLNSPTTASATAAFTAGDQGIFVTGYSVNGGNEVAAYSSVSNNWTGSATLFGGATSSTPNGADGPYYGGIGVRSITTAAASETVSMTVTSGGALRPSITVTSIIPSGVSCGPIPNRAPMAMPDTATTQNGVAVNIATATNDFFPIVGAVTYSILTFPASGSASINASGVVNYTPATSFNGVRSLTYEVIHTGGLRDTATVYINITNGPIDAVNDAPAGALSGVVQTINVKANDTDTEGAVVTSTVSITTAPLSGTATVDGSGNIVYTPNVGFTGNDTLFYSLCEPVPPCGSPLCDIARLIVTVTNRPPVANPETKTILPCYSNTINLIGNDTDPENGTLTVTNLSALSPGGSGTLVNNNDGTVTLTPATGFTGVITFTYTVIDDGITPQTSAPATVTITVQNPVNNAPIAVNDVESANMDQKLYASVRDNDSDPDNNPLTIPTITVAPLNGTAVVNPINGQIEYTPNPGYAGTDVLTYRICDIPIIIVATCTSGPDLCATATLTLSIIPIPESDNSSTPITQPTVGQFKTLNGGANPPILSGSDPVDCPAGCTITSKSVIFDAVPSNSELYYNGVLLYSGDQIDNFNPSLLQIKFTAATVGFISTSFQYSFVNSFGKKDPTPATYELTWFGVLPINFTSFTALPKGTQVNLQWKVSDQINVARYEAIASTDGRNFNTTIATVAANTNNSGIYDAVHSTPVAGINYYRIKTIDKDGSISYSEIRKVTFGKAGTVTVYPNPAIDMVNITLTGSMINKAATLSLLSMDGKLLSQQRITNTGQTETINVSTLANGSYIVRLVTNDEVINKIIQVLRQKK